MMGVGKGFGKGKGGGKGFRRKTLINRTKADKKVWIGGLPKIEDRDKRKEASRKLQEHMKKAGDCKFAEIFANGEGGAIYSSEEEAAAAIGEMNGTKFKGKLLEVDTWEKKTE